MSTVAATSGETRWVSPTYAWATLALLFVVLGSGIFALDTMPPLFLEITNDFPLTATQMGAVISAFHLASPFFTPIGGILVDRYGPRRMLTLGLIVLTLAGGARILAEDATTLIAVMFLMGVGFSIFGPNVPKVLGSVFAPAHLARANGIVFSGVGAANAIALGTAATILSPVLGGWRGVMVATAVFTGVLGVLWFLFYRDNPGKPRGSHIVPEDEDVTVHETILEQLRNVIRVRDIWGVALFYALPGFAYWGLLAQVPPALGNAGIEHPGVYVAVMTGTSFVANIIGGQVSDMIGRRKPVLMVCVLGMAAMLPLIMVVDGMALYAVMLCTGLFFGPIIPVALTIPVELPEIGTRYAGTALGLIFMVANIGAIAGPLVLGFIIDLTGLPLVSLLVASVCLVISIAPLSLVRESGPKGMLHADAVHQRQVN